MEYKSIAFDMNKPMVQQIAEPLNSVYGVAVKVYKDEQLVSADLSVGGTTCTEGPGGWKLAELSSGNVETMKTLEVVAVKDGGSAEINASHEEIDTWGGDYDVQAAISLSSYAGLELSHENLQTPIGKVTSEFPDGQSTVTDWNENVITIYADGIGGSNVILWNKTTGWSNVSVSLTENSVMRVDYHYPANATKSTLTINIQVSSGEGLSAAFQLYVQEKDLGYIEVNDISTKPEPTPDPEETVEQTEG